MFQLINSGSRANTDNADTIREAFHKINMNFTGVSASLDFYQSGSATAGTQAGYAVINLSGSSYKFPIYNM
jgi:hypothetical protein